MAKNGRGRYVGGGRQIGGGRQVGRSGIQRAGKPAFKSSRPAKNEKKGSKGSRSIE